MTNEAAWNVTPHSDSRMNRMTNIPNTGAVLATLDKTKHGILICTSSGSGLIKDHVYFCNADGDSLIDLSSIAPHLHTSNIDGGDFLEILSQNSFGLDLMLTKVQDLKNVNWNTALVLGGSVEDDIDGTSGERSIQLKTNTTSGGAYTIKYPHLNLGFDKVANFVAKIRIETASSLALHIGVGADDVTSADSNNRKFQAEVCTTTNNNWWLRTANGSANSASDSGVAISTSRTGVAIHHDPTGEDRLLINDNLAIQKTSNVATDGNTASSNVIKFSIKNSTAANRSLFMYGCRLTYSVKDNWG